MSTTLTISSATPLGSASSGTIAANAFNTSSPKPLYGPASYSATRASSAGRPECAKWFVPLVNAPGTTIRRLDAPARQLARIEDGQRVHRRFGREIGREIGRRSASGAAARYPDEQALFRRAHVRQDGPVDALRAEHVDVVLLRELLGQERLGRAEHHVTRIVDQHVDLAALGHDLLDRHIDRRLGLNVELDRAQVDAIALRGLGHLGRVLGVAASDIAHRGVDGVSGLGERFGRQAAEAAGSAGDENDLLAHDGISIVSVLSLKGMRVR